MKDETPERKQETGDSGASVEEPSASSRISYGEVKQVDKTLTATEAVQLLSKVQGQPHLTDVTEDQVTVTNYS